MKAAELLAPGVPALAAEIFLDSQSLFVRFSEPFGSVDTLGTLPEPNCFLKKRGGWFVRYQGLESVYPPFDGFTHTHTLLGYPRRDCLPADLLRCVSVLEVNPDYVHAALQEGFRETVDLGDVLDAETQKAIRKRLVVLGEAEEEARLFARDEDLERVQDERDRCLEYLRKACAKGNARRRAGSRQDADRQRVWQAVRRAHRLIETHDPALARFLKASITTKSLCRYDPVEPTAWLL